MRSAPVTHSSMRSFFALPAAIIVAMLLSAPGCSGEDEKARPEFMSKPASTQGSTTAGSGAEDPAPNTETSGDEIATQPSTPRTPTTPSSEDDPDRSATIVIVEGPDADDDESDIYSDEMPTDEYDADQVASNSDEESDSYGELDEEQDDEEEEPSEENGDFFYGSTRPFIPVSIDIVSPAPSVQNVDVAAAPAPTASQLVPVIVPWAPAPQSELDILRRRENDAQPTAEQLLRMKDYGRIPSGDDPNPDDHP